MALKKELIDKITRYGLKPPETLTLAITGKCNLNCPHCLIDCENTGSSHVPAHVIKRLITEFHELGGNRLFLTGGEPLLHPDWFELFEFAFNETDFIEIGIQTNAILLKEEDSQKLLSLPAERLTLQVSLDGAGAETNDIVRGNGNFKATVAALRLLASRGLGGNTCITFTEMRHNHHELPEVIELVNKIGLKSIRSNTLLKAGRSVNYGFISLPDEDQIRNLIKKYNNDPAFHDLYEKCGNISAIEWFKGRANTAELVCNCISTPYISADGKLFPCAMYLSNALAVAGVHDLSLETVIAEGLLKWAELPGISKKRSNDLSECKGCAGHSHCGGGCPGRADAVNGSVMTVEDRCNLRKAVYSIE